MKRPVLALAMAGLLLAATASAALATTTKIATDGTEVLNSVVPGTGTATFNPVTNVASLRGEIHLATVTSVTHWPTGDVTTTSAQTGDFNYDVSMVTGVGTFWGTANLAFTAGGGLVCTYEGVFPASTGHSVCHGYGTVSGMQSRADFYLTASPPGSISHGYVFWPANKQA